METDRVAWEEARAKIEEATQELDEKLRGLEAPIFEGILEYLIHHYTRSDKCTLREIERALGVPYTRLKRFVDVLKKDGIVTEIGVGTAKVLTVTNPERAIEQGYLSGDLDKLQNWSVLPFLKPEEGSQFRDRVWQAALLSRIRFVPFTFGGAPQALRAADFAWDWCERYIYSASHRRLMAEPEFRDRDGAGERRAGTIDRHNQFVRTRGEEDGVSHLTFDEGLEERIVAGMEGIERIVYRLGFMPLFILPYLHSIVGPQTQDQRMLFWPKAVLARDVWFELGCPEEHFSLEEGWKAAVRVFEKQLKYLTALIRPTYGLIEEKGIEGALEALNAPERVGPQNEPRPVSPYTRTNLLYHALPLTYAALIVLALGGDPELFRAGKRMAQILRAAVEQEYRGREAEGAGLEEWFDRQQAAPASAPQAEQSDRPPAS